MQASNGHPFVRPGWLNTYIGYSICCGIAWAALLAIAAAVARKHTLTESCWCSSDG
jgi:hypothetical protein